MEKKEISRFEFAIMQTACPDEAKKYKPILANDELVQRKKSMVDAAKKFRLKP